MSAENGPDYSNFDPRNSKYGGDNWNTVFNDLFGLPGRPTADRADLPTIADDGPGLPTLAAAQDDPFRLKVQKMLVVALRQITTADGFGFYCDLNDSVFRGRRFFDENDPLPMVSILEEPFAFDQTLSPGVGQTPDDPYELILQGFVDDGPRRVGDMHAENPHPTDGAHYLLADVKRRLAALKVDERHRGGRVFRFGTNYNSVVALAWDGGVVRPADEVSGTAHFWLRVSMLVSEDVSQPMK